jgi:hypothetical protein
MTKRLANWRIALEQGRASTDLAPVLGADKMTRNGLLRFFYVALVMNHSSYEKYRIPGWKGAMKPSPRADELVVPPGGLVLLSSVESLAEVDERLEIYRIRTGQDGEFEILARNRYFRPSLNLDAARDVTIILNLTRQSLAYRH